MAIKVYVVDDSAVVRQTLLHLLKDDAEFEMMGSAPNPLIAAPIIRKNRPDVLLLDIEMPGMGDDGARGMKQLHDGGARTVAQNEESCIVFGMPKEAIALGAIDQIVDLSQVAQTITGFDARG